MKIRIKGNSIRLRLSQNEVTELAAKGEIIDSCAIGSSTLYYGIYSQELDEITAEMQNNRIIVRVPNTTLDGWEKDTRVGFHNSMANGTFILIEKDFKCLVERTNEDETNLYPNPRANN